MNFNVSKEDDDLILKVAIRAQEWFREPRIHLCMDLTVFHLHQPMNLQALLNAKDSDFVHDVAGIMKHVNRVDGTTSGVFCPRYARSNHEST